MNGEGDKEGATYFLPPGVTMVNKCGDQEDAPQQTSSKEKPAPREEEEGNPWICTACLHTNISAKYRCNCITGEGRCMAWRGGKRGVAKPYFRKVRDVIERVLEKKSVAEAKAADAFVELVPEASEMFTDKKEKKYELSPHPDNQKKINHFAWKDERTHYEKSSSRVGPEFQVAILPAAGSYTYTTTVGHDGDAL